MKFAVVSLYGIVPPTTGAASVTYHLAKFLPGQRVAVQLGPNDRERLLEDNLTLISVPNEELNRLRKAWGVVRKMDRLVDIIRSLDPDVVFLEGGSWTLYYLILLRRLRRARIRARIIYHAHNVEFKLRMQRDGLAIAFLTRLAERALTRGADLTTAVSEVDAALFEQLYGVRPKLLPNGVDTDRFGSVDERRIQAVRERYGLVGKVVLFMGLLTYPPTRRGLDFLIDDVFPEVRRRCPEARLAVTGGELGLDREWLINPGIIPFEDVPAFIKACDVCAAPIFSGSGTRVKILEYMAAGKPVVATVKGAEGLAVVDGQDLLMAEDSGRFAEAIVSLLTRPDQARAVGERGRRSVTERFSWTRIVRDFLEDAEDVIPG